MTTVFMFPGQTSRYTTMLQRLVDLRPANRDTIAEASDIVDFDIIAHYSENNHEVFATNRHVQIGVFLANYMHMTILDEAGITADASLGLSLGEWNHLVHIGAVTFEEALGAVNERGAAYDAGPRGIMAAVFPITLEELQGVVEKARGSGVVEIVNLNSPRQQVVAGDHAAVEEVLALIEEETTAYSTIIEEQVPMHCSTFASVGTRFRAHLEEMSFTRPRLPYLSNRRGDFVDTPTQESFVDLLSTHVHEPVLWQKSLDRVLEEWPDATLVEVGPKRVLNGMLGRKWHKGVNKLCTDTDDDDPRAHIDSVIAALGGDAIYGAASSGDAS